MTRKKVFQKKLQLLKNLSCEIPKRVRISKSGNYFVYLNRNTNRRTIKYTAQNVCKSFINKLFTERSFDMKSGEVIVMNKKGEIRVQYGHKFVKLGIKSKYFRYRSSSELLKLIFFNKKYEWIANLGHFCHTRIAYQFSSLKEFKIWLGYEFLSNEQFEMIYSFDRTDDIIIYSKMLSHDSRVAINHHILSRKIDDLKDTIKMMVETNKVSEIPLSKEKLMNLHDDLVMEVNKGNALKYSDIPYDYSGFNYYFKLLKDAGYNFELLDTPRKLFLRGCSNNHCLATYSNNLDKNIFISFILENGQRFESQVTTAPYTGEHALKPIQCRGYRNESAPQSLGQDISNFCHIFNANYNVTGMFPIIVVPKDIYEQEPVMVDLPF